MKEMLWLLFENTGKIEYYLKYKKYGEVVDRNDKTS